MSDPHTLYHRCPYLGLRDDPETWYTFPAHENTCHKPRSPHGVAAPYQENICLTDQYADCPVYQQMREWRGPLPSNVKIIQPPASIASSHAPRTRIAAIAEDRLSSSTSDETGAGEELGLEPSHFEDSAEQVSTQGPDARWQPEPYGESGETTPGEETAASEPNPAHLGLSSSPEAQASIEQAAAAPEPGLSHRASPRHRMPVGVLLLGGLAFCSLILILLALSIGPQLQGFGVEATPVILTATDVPVIVPAIEATREPTMMPPTLTATAPPTQTFPTATTPILTLSASQAIVETWLLFDTNLRTGPGTEYEILAYLNHGIRVVIVGRNQTGVWLVIHVEDGREGWVAASQLDTDDIDILALPVIPAPPPAVTP